MVPFQATEWLIVIELKVTKDSIMTILLPLVYMKVFFKEVPNESSSFSSNCK